MKHIDLADAQSCEIFQYPGGETQSRLTYEARDKIKRLAAGTHELDLVWRFGTEPRLIVLPQIVDAIRALEPTLHIHLWVPYLPYARADRRFVLGDTYGLGVFGALINSLALDSVITLDPHSPAAFTSINRLNTLDPLKYIERAIVEFWRSHNRPRAISLLFPDAGAQQRYQLPNTIGCNTVEIRLDQFNSTKIRNPETGRLTGFQVPVIPSQPTLVIDDICDGGGTFNGLAPQLPEPRGLYITHGIFSGDMQVLQSNYPNIYTTDSYNERSVFGVTKYPIPINTLCP